MKYKDYIFVAVLTIIMVLSTAYIVKPGPITIVQEAPQEKLGSTVQHAQWEFVNGIRMGLNRVQITESDSTVTVSGNITGEGESNLFGNAATSTVQVGAASKSGCFILGDSDNGASVVYITATGATITASTTKPAACQTAQ